MTAPPRTDPAPGRPDAAAGSRRPRVLLVLAIGVLAASLVRGLVLESYHVPSGGSLPSTLEPGDRVLVLKTGVSAGPGELVLVESAGAARVVTSDAATDTASGDVVGRVVTRFWPLDRIGAVPAEGEVPR